MLNILTAIWLGVALLHGATSYYTSRRCYGTGDCHLMTKNQDGGFDDAQHQWLVECSDGEGVVAIRDDDTHFEGLSGMWCSFLFPLKQSSKGMYPYYPSCLVRNLSAGEYHCSGASNSNHTAELFVSGIYKEPNDKQVFVPSLMKCCEMPTDYQIDYTRCYYKKTFDRFGEHYTGEWLVKCDTHHLVTGIGKDTNPWDNKEHFTWIQCCPFYYTAPQYKAPIFNQNYAPQLMEQPATNYDLNNIQLLNDPGKLPPLTSSGRTDYFPESTGPANTYTPAQLNQFSPAQFRSYKLPTMSSGTPSNYYPAAQVYPQQPTFIRKVPDGSAPPNFYNPPVNYPSGTGGYLINQTMAAPLLDNPPMNAIQYYANVAAYHQFIDTFNGLLSNFSKQQKAIAANPTGNGYLPGPVVGGYTPMVYQQAPPPVSLATAMQMNSGEGYVQPALPSGLQNYIALTSPNPGATLSSLYGAGPYQSPANDQYQTYGRPMVYTAGYTGSGEAIALQQYGGLASHAYGAPSVAQLQLENQQLQYLLNLKQAGTSPAPDRPTGESSGNTLTVANVGGGGVELKTNGSLVVSVPVNGTTP